MNFILNKITLSDRFVKQNAERNWYKNLVDAVYMLDINDLHISWSKTREIREMTSREGATRGLSGITIEFNNSSGDSFILNGNWSWNFGNNSMEFYVFSGTKRPATRNGLAVQHLNIYLSFEEAKVEIKKVYFNKGNFEVVYNDSTDILDALRIYASVLSDTDEKIYNSYNVEEFSQQAVYEIDSSFIKDKKEYYEDKNVFKLDSKYFTNENRIDFIDQKYVVREGILFSTKIKKERRSGLVRTLKDLLKSNTGVTHNNKRKFTTEDESNNIALIDFKVLEKKNETKLSIVLEEGVQEGYLHIVNILNLVKNRTVLSVIKKIEENKIPNNDVFQYLFNNGKFPTNNRLSGWPNTFENSLQDGLNESQLEAFQMAIDNFPITFIQGPPGTGKTEIISRIVKHYSNNNMKVLISSQTNVAVENVLNKLWNDMNFQNMPIKVEAQNKSKYSENTISDKIIEKITSITGWEISNTPRFSINESQSAKNYKIIGSTTTSASLSSRKWREWTNDLDVLIIDEISKSNVPEIIRYSLEAKKIIYVGDQKQLPPMDDMDENILKTYTERERLILKKYISTSIFTDKYNEVKEAGRAKMLNVNYRSLPVIANVYSKFYEDGLIPNRKADSSSIKFKKDSIYKALNFIAVNGATESNLGYSRFNQSEIDATKNVIQDLIKSLDDPKKYTIAIISQYGAQIRKMIESGIQVELKKFKSGKIDTVDGFQGDQADIVIVSTVIADRTKNLGFIENYKRINVAFSRAKDMLFILGNDGILSSIESKIEGEEPRTYMREIINEIKLKKGNDDTNFIIVRGQ